MIKVLLLAVLSSTIFVIATEECSLSDVGWCASYPTMYCNVTQWGTYTASYCPIHCDTPEYYLAELDCECVHGGDKVIDACGVCGGDGSSCATTEAEATTAAPSTAVGGEDCKALDEAGCAAQPDSCHAKNRGGKFRKCKPKRCKPMTESECEAAVHCEKKMGRRGDYKKCRRA